MDFNYENFWDSLTEKQQNKLIQPIGYILTAEEIKMALQKEREKENMREAKELKELFWQAWDETINEVLFKQKEED